MAPTIDIEFENDQKMYFPGQVVSGKVIMTMDKTREIKVIEFKVKGIGHVSFLYFDHSSNEHKTASASETYYMQKFNLWGDGTTSETFDVGTTHQYDFSFTLPNGIPSSFESSDGYVRHTCKVAVDIENRIFDAKCTAKFSVGAVYDLNTVDGAEESISLSNDKNLGCLCCAAGNISFNLKVDHSGYVPGENIVINAECSNESSRPSSYTEAKVIQTVTYRASGKKEEKTKDICSVRHPSVGPGKDDIWLGELLNIPPVPPSRLPGCNLIDIEYTLKFIFSPSGMSMSLNRTAEIIIGTIPLRRVFNMLTKEPQIMTIVASDENTFAPDIGLVVPKPHPLAVNGAPPPYPWAEMYPDLVPPSYAECPMGSRRPSDSEGSDSDTAEGEKKAPSRPFAPQFVSYGWKKP